MRVAGIIALLLLAFASAHGQAYRAIIEKNAQKSFHEIRKEVETYYADKDKGRGSGYKQFKRWEYYNARRLDENGRLQNVPKRLLDEFTKYQMAYIQPPDLNFDCEWESLGGQAYQVIVSGHNGGLGRVNCIVLDPADANIIYAGTPAGGLWRTTSAGGWNPGSSNTSFWTPLSDGLPNIGVSGIAIDPGSPPGSRTIYILTGDGDSRDNPSLGVLKSLDGGATWYQTGLSWGTLDFNYGYKLVMHPENANILFAATTDGIYRTQDGGITWTQELGNRIYDIEFRPGTPDTMYAVGVNSFFRSIDGGLNWTPNNTLGCAPTPSGIRMAVAVTPADPDFVYVLSGGNLLDGMGNPMAGTFIGVFRSTDSGACFTARATTPNILDGSTTGNDIRQQAGYDLCIAVSPTDENEVHVGGINSWRSLDGGQTWAITAHWNEASAGAGDYNHADVHAIEYFGNTIYSGSDGGVWISTNEADDWQNISQGLKITQYYRIAAFSDGGSDYAMGGAQDNGLNQYEDGGAGFGNLEHWEGADGFEVSIDVADDFAFGATQNGSIVRYNYATNAFTDVSPNDTGAWLTPHAFDAVNDALLAGYTDVLRTTDHGGSWNNISNGQIGNGLCSQITLAPSNSNVIYVAVDNNPGAALFRTIDGGANWNNITGTLPVANNIITYISVDPANQDRVWVTLGGFVNSTNPNAGFQPGDKVFFSPDGGAMWNNISGTLPNIPANCVIYENGSNDGLYVAMDVGVYYRDNTMTDWVLFSNELPNVIVSELEINYTTGKLYAGTFGRGIWCSDLFSACNRECLNCPTFAGIQSPSNTYSSENCIYSSVEVFDDAAITYEAQEFILLQDRFHSDGDDRSVFHGVITPCAESLAAPPTYLVNHRGLPGFYIGTLPGAATAGFKWNPLGEPKPGKGLEVFPNPTNGSLRLNFELATDDQVFIALYDMTGKKITDLESGSLLGKGKHQRTYDLRQLSSGTYILEVICNGERRYEAVVKY
jgi:hypothetical protein